MAYSIKQLAELAGVSTRTLRWYDSMGLLSPTRLSNGYRVYGTVEVDRLQQILFFRELGFGLDEISALMRADDYDVVDALRTQLNALASKRTRLNRLMATLEKTIATYEEGIPMSDTEKFEAFKQEALLKNEERYGAEIREKYGDDIVDASNRLYAGMTAEDYAEMEALTEQLSAMLKEAAIKGDPKTSLAQEVAAMHKRWLGFFWPEYSPEAHRGVTQMYVDDPRFSAYYEKIVPDGATFLRDAVWAWLDEAKTD
ncbi:MAG: MerR family transcriptional regulator [Coriobacteriales bacterium]|jgi:DNA-binding transcriptional MerR regulator|nr:MerR family transcriptional regulator [Coriobacteriales bacterium]